MKLKFNGFLVLLVVLVAQLTFAQERSVSGIVSDNAGIPLPGVSVLVKGTKNGTQSDFDGKYSIKAAPSDVLVFSYVGMKSSEKSASSTTVNVKLASDATQLESVVVTSLGIKRDKKSLGYSTQEVKGADLSAGASTGNFINDLSGKVAGVSIRRNNNFGGSTNIVSRGIKNLTGNNQMLIVIDGMPMNNSNTNNEMTAGQNTGRGGYDYGNAAMDVNPDDIESVNILKGAAASALYGWQAGNGVVMITTKKGKAKKGMGITLSSEFTTSTADKATFPKYQDKYGGGYGPFYSNGPTGPYFDEDANGDLVVPTYEDASYGAPFDPTLSVYQWNAYSPYTDHFGQKTPWVAAKNGPFSFFQTANTFSNSVSMEDATDKTSFVMNYNNYKQTGIMPNSELKKNTLSVKVNHQFTDKLSTAVFANYTSQSTVGRNSTGYNDNILTSFRQWFQTNVDIQEQKQAFERSGGQNITWNMQSPTTGATNPIYWDNPYFTRYKNYQTDNRNRFTGYAKVDYKLFEWLTASGKISTDTYAELREERRAVGSIPATFGINALDESSGYARYNGNFSEQNYEGLLTFKKNINEDFSFNGVAGGNILRTNFTSIFATTQGGLIVPGLYSLTNSVNTVPFPIERQDFSGVNSVFGSASFGYKEFLFVDGTARRDSFSTLPKDNNSVNTFSVSGSYVFTKHIDQPWLSFGKLRASYAENPQGNIALHSLVNTYSKFDPFGSNQQYSLPSTLSNANLRPVKTASEEIGLEMQFLDRRIGFDVAVYKSLSSDQIFDVDYSTAVGANKRFINAGSVENKGIEVQFNVTPVKTADFAWDIFVNWSKNENTVVELTEGIENLQLGSFQQGVTINASVGQPYGTIKGTDYTYLNGEKVVGTNGRYIRNTATTNVIGNVTPDWIGGIRNKFTYKQFSLGFLLDMQKGGDIFSLDQAYGQATGLYKESAGLNDLGNPMRNTIANGGGVILPGVQQDGTPNTIRTAAPDQYGNIAGYRQAPNKAFIYDAGYIKLREANITYNLPSSIVSKMKLTALSFAIVGSNLWIIDKSLPYADPESGTSSGNLSSGYSVGSLPTTRNIGGNVTIKF
ncbi:TonB-linked SusC/RagA family outer membrane protein [Flavobacterium sp. 103]|uniref:SusC/RagA family TonB-linked outer membrane protein n=1 Tax=Flavobacterium sp. 103 TaxID=2135624 RepID=UPI000D5D0F1F|nr:SusC/RagA family TonB-linked outer membrane protein [Flavobacterium sp. 103]PVX46527.1 TonB-linked SusC/RagA family outer membrane protein [Flavobacterium sp. 103]